MSYWYRKSGEVGIFSFILLIALGLTYPNLTLFSLIFMLYSFCIFIQGLSMGRHLEAGEEFKPAKRK